MLLKIALVLALLAGVAAAVYVFETHNAVKLWDIFIRILDALPLVAFLWAVYAYFDGRARQLLDEERHLKRQLFVDFLEQNAKLSMKLKSDLEEYRAAYASAAATADQVNMVSNSDLYCKIFEFREIAARMRHFHEAGKDHEFQNEQYKWHSLHKETLLSMKRELADK